MTDESLTTFERYEALSEEQREALPGIFGRLDELPETHALRRDGHPAVERWLDRVSHVEDQTGDDE